MLGISQPAVSRHLRQLAEAGLVADERRALWTVYRLSTAATNEYVPVLLRHISRWANQDSRVGADQRLARRAGRRAPRRRA